MSTTLRSVPAPAGPTQLPTFRDRGMQAMQTHQGPDLVSYLAMLHDQDMAEVVAQAAAARSAVVEVTSAAAIDQQLLASLMAVIQPALKISGENAARAHHFADVVEAVRQLAREAETQDDGRVDVEQLRQILDVPAQPPKWRPLVLGLVPTLTYRAGQFREANSEKYVTLPFVGYAMCQDAPDRPMVAHMTFLREGIARPRPQLYHEFGLILEHVE